MAPCARVGTPGSLSHEGLHEQRRAARLERAARGAVRNGRALRDNAARAPDAEGARVPYSAIVLAGTLGHIYVALVFVALFALLVTPLLFIVAVLRRRDLGVAAKLTWGLALLVLNWVGLAAYMLVGERD